MAASAIDRAERDRAPARSRFPSGGRDDLSPESAPPLLPVGDHDARSPAQMQLSQRIAGLIDFSSQQMREEWRRLYRSQPPRLSRDLLIRTIAYRMQELAYGGPSKATLRKLQTLTKDLESNGQLAGDAHQRIRPGMRLVREWHGRTHTVVVTEDGFEFASKTYSSLSQIARAITGAHWSGPRFFGLNQKRSSDPRSGASTMIGEGGDSDG
jgi:hypothetical protein